tara:strand:- start:195 stop:2444 length:2250 start_codon:yes stop_codon:yes gene_type:complete
MLKKIDLIEEVGRFRTLTQKAPHLSKLALIYARNGYGKSTVCAILRSATNNDPTIVRARRRIQANKPSRIQTTWAGGSASTFSSDKWSAWPGKVHVFDQDYVSQNVFIGESVTRENKRSLLPVVLGEAGVALAQKVSDLDKEQRGLEQDEKTYSNLISAKFPVASSVGVLKFCSAEIPEDIDARIVSAQKELELARQATAVTERRELPSLRILSLTEIEAMLQRTIDDVAADAVTHVKDHIEKHKLGPNSQQWLKYGFDHNKEETCPYCDQDVTGLKIIDAYKAYFSESYTTLNAECEAVLVALKSFKANPNISDRWAQLNRELDFWKTVCELPVEPSLSSEELEEIESGVDVLIDTMVQKTSNPLGVVSLGESRVVAEKLYQLIDSLNGELAQCAAAIQLARTSASASNLQEAGRKLQYLKALKGRGDAEVADWATKYVAVTERKAALETEKKAEQKKLREYAESTVGSRQKDINNLLSNFGANFSVVDTKANFKGREPNAEFAIEISKYKVIAGEKKADEPSFGTVLSSGDKTTLALAFFLSQVLADADLASSVVVFDDPFNSQDLNRQFETTSQIRALSEKAAQTIVFSHDPRFLFMIEKDSDSATTCTLQLRCTIEGDGSLTQWKSSDTLKALYVRQSEIIREYATHGKPLKGESENSVLQAIRPFLEDYIRARFPGRFGDKAMLAEMIEAITDAGSDDPLYTSVSDLTSLNEYTRPNMHGGGTTPDEDALRAQCRKVVGIIGAY